VALLFCDGFDWYLTADLAKRWTSVGSAATTTTAVRRAPSVQAASLGGNAGAVSAVALHKSFGANYATGCIGFAWYSTAVASKSIAMIIDGTSEQISIRTNSSSVLTVNQGNNVRATGSTVLSTNTWYYIELKFTIHNSAGIVELKLNGATEIASTSSLDTTGTANAYFNGFGFFQTASDTRYVDDVYALDTGSGANTNFLGPVIVTARYPDGNGNASDWTPNGGSNMGCVSEMFEDGDGSFNQSATAGHIDTFTMQNLPAAAGSVFAVAQHTIAAQDGGAARTIRQKLRIAGTNYSGANVATSSSYQMFSEYRDTSPATSSAWSVAEVDGMESGYELVS
jgi:hypothetical protein